MIEIVQKINYYLSDYVLVFLLLGTGLFYTFRTNFVQIRCFREGVKKVFGDFSLKGKERKGGMSSFQALATAVAAQVGTGNIVGASGAILTGGPGAIFWMWITAILGGASAFVESTLAQIYKKKDPEGGSYGGPAYYIEAALHSRTLAIVFSIALIFTYGVGYNMLASYNLQSSFAGFGFYSADRTPLILGGIVALLTLYCLLGGGKRIAKITGVLVPIMGVLYVLLALIALVMNVGNLGSMFSMIFADAFNFKAIFGGFLGSCMMLGFKRGLYSNEAGIGSAPNAAAAADVSHPAKQGLVQMLSVFIDTLLLCTATAFMCMCSGVSPEADLAGAPYVQAALSHTFGSVGPIFIAVAMFLFAFTTLLGNFYYIENCFAYILKKTPSKGFMNTVRVVGAILIFLGAVVSFGFAWDMADICQCILAFINIPVCIVLGGVAYRALDNYTAQKKAGKK